MNHLAVQLEHFCSEGSKTKQTNNNKKTAKLSIPKQSLPFPLHFYTPPTKRSLPQLFPAWLWLIFHIHEDNVAKLDWKVHRRESYPRSAGDLLHRVLQSPQIHRVHSQLGESAPEKSISAMLRYTSDKLISSKGNFDPSRNAGGFQRWKDFFTEPSLD